MATTCSTGHRILTRIKSHKKLRMASEESKPLHRRQTSDPSDGIASSRSPSTTSAEQRRAHYPPIEFDPLKLNPPVAQVSSLPMQQHDSFQERTLRTKRSLGGNEFRRPRFHHSDSGLSIDVQEGFDFGFEKQKTLERMLAENQPSREAVVDLKGWPSPASTTDSEGSWFHDNDDDDEEEEEPAKRVARLFGEAPTPRARPQIGPDDYLKRGGWKRQGIVFGGQSEDVYLKEEDAFDFS